MPDKCISRQKRPFPPALQAMSAWCNRHLVVVMHASKLVTQACPMLDSYIEQAHTGAGGRSHLKADECGDACPENHVQLLFSLIPCPAWHCTRC